MTLHPLPPTATIPSSEIARSQWRRLAAMATQPSNAGKTHHRDVGRKNSTVKFPKKGLKGEGEGEQRSGELCGWRRGASLAEGFECCIQTLVQTRKPAEARPDRAGHCETPPTCANITSPHSWGAQCRRMGVGTCLFKKMFLLYSLKYSKYRDELYPDQSVDFVTESVVIVFALLRNHI